MRLSHVVPQRLASVLTAGWLAACGGAGAPADVPATPAGSAGSAGGDVGPNAGAGGLPNAQGGGQASSSGSAGAAAGGLSGGGASGGSASDGGSGGAGPAPSGACAPPSTGHYQLEDLDRGVVAVPVTGGVYVGWRMLGYEYDKTAANVSYDLYRDGSKVANVTDSTNYLDKSGTAASSYAVSAVIKGNACGMSAASKPWAQEYLSIPLTPPADGPHGGTYSANDASVGDLDGDGQLDLVLKWDPSNAKDNSQSGVTDDVFVDGYTLAGARLFRIDLGPNIRAGAHYTQLSVYDLDGDGKA